MQQDRDHLHQHHERGAAGNDQEEITSQPKSNPRSKNPSLPSQAENNQEHHEAQNCPRCDSANTKFCYYNNYSLTQPRYFCKTCRRYWTQGGTLRNVPVGGGCRKATKRAKTASTSATSSLPNILNNNSSSGSMLTQPASLPPLSPLLLPPSPPLSQNMIMGSSSNSIQFSSGGYAISSLPTINDHNHPHPHHQSLFPQFQPPSMIDLSANYTGQSARLGSNLGLYEPAGFNIHPFGLSSHQVPFYPSHHDQGSLMTQSNSRSTNTTRARNSSSQHHYDEWYHDDQIGFIDNINNQTAAADASLWTIGNNSTTAAGSSSGGGPTTKWHDNHHLPGFHGGPDHQAP